MTEIKTQYKSYASTDTGKRRSLNEDIFICDPDRAIFLVADGMGGENYGEVASQMTAEFFVRSLTPYILDEDITIPFENTDDNDFFSNAVTHAVEMANSAVLDYVSENKSYRGMGSTLTAAICNEHNITVAHIGDSRLYRIRKKNIEQITEDHTKVQEMVNKHIISSIEAKKHPQRNVITRCIGRRKHIKPDIFTIQTKDQDIFLICSDGLYDMVDDTDIQKIVIESDNFEIAVQNLIDLANTNGGKDNITVVIFQNTSGQ
jgi:protein phosphatase